MSATLRHTLPALAVMALLAACGSGKNLTAGAGGGSAGGSGGNSGGGNGSPSLQGIYYGSFTAPTGGTLPVYGAILPTGFGEFADVAGDVYVLPAISNPSSITGTVSGFAGAGRLFPNGSTRISYTLSGAASAPDSNNVDNTLSAQVFQGSLPGSLQLGLKGISESTLPLSNLSGSYTGFYWGSLVPINLTISSIGVIAGNDNHGCAIAGQLASANGNHDLYSASLQITGSGCPGSVNGVAYDDVDDIAHVFAAPTDFILYIGASNSTAAVVMEIQR